MKKYICMRKCYWAGILWEVGQKYMGDDEPPHHFAELGKEDQWTATAPDRKKLEAESMKVKNTYEVDGVEVDPDSMTDDQLRAELDRRGIKYDPKAKTQALLYKFKKMVGVAGR